MDAGSERRALATRILIDVALAACVALAPMSALAMCDVIPGVETRFRGALGSLDRPFSIPNDVGQQLTITLDSAGCDSSSTGFTDLPGGSVPEDDYFVSIVFKPPGGGDSNAVVLTTAANSTTCDARIAAGQSQLGGGVARCRTVAPGTLEFTISSPSELGLRFPDTDAELAPDGDDHTFTGPAAIAVTPVSDPVPFSLVAGRCATTAGVVACIDELYAWDGTCEDTSQHRDPIFGHFTALPPANDYETLCKTANSVCDGTATELRLTVDADGHALIPMDWRGVLIRADGIPIARLVTGTSDFPAFSSAPTVPIGVPGESFLASYAPGGQLLPPVFAPLSEEGTSDLSLFGSVDAPIGVIRLARRAPDLSGPTPVYSQCMDFPDTPCQMDSDCATGTCGAATCRGGTNDGNACTVDADCPGGGECGPGLFDLSDRLDGDVGPILVANTPGTLDLEAAAPVPLEGLVDSPDVFAFVQLESIAGATAGGGGELTPLDLNGDSDTYDAVLVLRDRESGIVQTIGEDFGGGPALGRAVARLRDTFYSTAALVAEDDIVAFLEPEPQQGDCSTLDTCDHNDDGDVFDTILRVYQLGQSSPITLGLDEAVDAAGEIDGRALALSDGLVFFRQNEWARALQTTTVVNQSTGFGKRYPVATPDGRFISYSSQAQEIPEDTNSSIFDAYVLDRDLDGDGIFDEVGETKTVLVSVDSSGANGTGHSFSGGISADGRYIAFCSYSTELLPPGVDTNGFLDVYVHDRDADSDNVFDEPGSIDTIRVNVSSSGAEADGGSCYPEETAIISDDGRYVVFTSQATNLVPGDQNGTGLGSDDVYVHDRDADEDGIFDEVGAVENIRVNNDPAWRALFPEISSDGRFVAFMGRVSTRERAIVHDRDTDADGVFDEPGSTSYSVVEVSSDGELGESGSVNPAISDDGRFVIFTSNSGNLVSGDTNGGADTFLHDRDTDQDGIFDESGAIQTIILSRRPDGSVAGGGQSQAPSISPDGRFVAFHYLGAEDIAPEQPSTCFPSAQCTQTFRFDRITRLAELVSRTDAGVSNGYNSSYSHISDLGRHVPLTGTALTPGSINGVYVRGPEPADATSDLTGDLDLDDTVLRVLDARVVSPTPTTLAPATQVSVAHGSAAFLSPERALGGDLNADGDAVDEVVHLYRNRIGSPVNLGRAAAQVALSERFVVARVREGQPGSTTDLNGDGDQTDTVLQVNAAGTATSFTWVDVGVAADDIAVVDTAGGPPTTVAFRTPECAEGGATLTGCAAGGTDLNADGDAADVVLQVYRPDQGLPGGLFSTGLAAEDFVLGERVLAFRTPECAEGGATTNGCPDGGTDLNGDGDAADSVLHVLDLATNQIFNTGQSVVACPAEACAPETPYRVADDIVTFVTTEGDQGGTDLNGDGDAIDLVVQFFNTGEAVFAAAQSSLGPSTAFAARASFASAAMVADQCVTPLAGASTGICSDTAEACSTDADCAAGSCYLPPGLCVQDLGGSCTSSAQCGPGEFCREGSCHIEGGSACANGSQCPSPEFCIDASEIGLQVLPPIEPRLTGQAIFASAGTRAAELIGTACVSDADCAPSEFCGEAGRCQTSRSDVVVTTAADVDGDGVPDPFDNCPRRANTNQADLDEDEAGDTCDLDADGDILLDEYETGTGVYVSPTDTGTSPTSADTDGDGFSDGEEVAFGSDPNDENDFPITPIPVPLLTPTAAAALILLLGLGAILGLSSRRPDRVGD